MHPRATFRLPHLRGHPLSSLEPDSPQRHIPGDSRSVTRPTRLAAARESRRGKGAAEGGAAACRWFPSPDTKRPARPAPPVPTRPAGLGAHPSCNPTSSRSQVSRLWPSRWPEALPAQIQPSRDRESKSRRRGPGRAGEPRAATHPGAQELPGSLRSAVEGRPQAPAPETSRAAARVREGASQGRGSRASAPASAQPGSPAPASEQPLSSSLASGQREACWRPMGTPRAGRRHGPPTSELPGRAVAAGCERCSLLLPAQRSALACALYRTHPAHTHSPHTHAARRPSAASRNVGAPPVTRLYAALFGWVPEKCDSLVLQKYLSAGRVPGTVLCTGKSPRPK